ncbi:hypothetical protein GCM10009838_46630 [Catenulispora subtropica]|uniref:Secreted protein n=1 Tax=Catenulispora subtropica TaxID=450798 RepID=A0ABN2S4B0_9ACTN
MEAADAATVTTAVAAAVATAAVAVAAAPAAGLRHRRSAQQCSKRCENEYPPPDTHLVPLEDQKHLKQRYGKKTRRH